MVEKIGLIIVTYRWGTSKEVTSYEDEETEEHEDGLLEFGFDDSVWSPPIGIFKTLDRNEPITQIKTFRIMFGET